MSTSTTAPEEPGVRWGPAHQHLAPPFSRRPSLLGSIAGLIATLLMLAFIHAWVDPRGGGAIGWTVRGALILFATRALVILVMAIVTRTPSTRLRPVGSEQDAAPAARPPLLPTSAMPAGAYLGEDTNGDWVHADPRECSHGARPAAEREDQRGDDPRADGVYRCGREHLDEARRDAGHARGQIASSARSGCSTRAAIEARLPPGLRRLAWSPIAGAASWDQALLLARAMTAAGGAGVGTVNEGHWIERAECAARPAHVCGAPDRAADRRGAALGAEPRPRTRAQCARGQRGAYRGRCAEWDPAHRFARALEHLQRRRRHALRVQLRRRRANAAHPNFDPERFTRSTDTIYITAPEHMQALCAPLIVGLLEQIRHAVYHRNRRSSP